MIKIFLFKVFFLIFFSIFSLKSFAEEKIAFIDVNYLFNVSLIGKDISNNINKLNQNLNIEATEFQKSIEIDKKNLESKKNILKEEEYKKLYNDLESKINQYNNTLKIKNDELNLYRNDAKKVFFDNLKIVMTEYSNIKSINLILKKENLLLAKNTLDITEDILNLLNEKITKITIN